MNSFNSEVDCESVGIIKIECISTTFEWCMHSHKGHKNKMYNNMYETFINLKFFIGTM